ncbi:MAG: HAMP domain-containing histidine kinase [Cyclobacteriaceae bacterium]|nr:HAMP domain-containing histidine kinase [Cyclobacteriaceae bacterium]
MSNKLYWKLSFTFLFILMLVGLAYVSITAYFSNKYFEETTQLLNAKVANHLIEEKFQNASPFLEDGSVNKPLFGDIMHDMMAVNRGIEVYLLDVEGTILYSVVLEHDEPEAPKQHVDLAPVKKFIENDGQLFILGDNPRNANDPKIFSAAHFDYEGHQGYIYIILEGKLFDTITSSLAGSYFMKLGAGSMVLALVFAMLVGLVAIWYLTRNLRHIIDTVLRFKEGDTKARIENAEKNDLAELATTFNLMADTINDNMDKLKTHDNLRRELISNVSHDLRTPLAIIHGYAETLLIKDKVIDEKDRIQYLNNINSSTVKLSNLVGQLFEYSKLEAKQIEPHKEPFLISELAMDLYYKYQLLARDKGIDLKIEMEENLPLVFADIALVERVIQNLLDNALKFTPEGGTISLMLGHTANSVEVTVKDTGMGISEQDQSFIFERYRKAKAATKENFGAGLGLAIVKKILDIHDASIKVISKPNQGAAFQFALPVYVTG